MALADDILSDLTDEAFGFLERPREVTPFSSRHPALDLDDAYRIVEAIRQKRLARGERIVGRKIGFTNSTAWAGYGISAPIWNYLYDTTTLELADTDVFRLSGQPNIRMETEIALGLGRAPHPDMTETDLLDCIDWVAPDFEICTSAFPDWHFKVADAAATGVHVALLLGPRVPIGKDRAEWARMLQSFSATLAHLGGEQAVGGGAEVLGSPVKAFGHLVRQIARHGGQPMQAGDIVTTGTLTRALPAEPNQTWTAHMDGIPLADIAIRLA